MRKQRLSTGMGAIAALSVVVMAFAMPAGAIVFVVDSTTDAVDANPGDGVCASSAAECTLRAAVMETNALPGADEIQVPLGDYQLTLPGILEDHAASGDLDILDDLTIEGLSPAEEVRILGEGGPGVRGEAQDVDRVLHLIGGGSTTLRSLTIANGLAPSGNPATAGGILSDGVLTLEHAIVADNRSDFLGGGISGGTVHVFDSTIRDNSSRYHAGIDASGGTILRSQILRNQTDGEDCGGVGGFSFISHTTFIENSGDDGGAVCGSSTIEDSVFERNGAELGGAIRGGGVIRRSRFSNNSGGAIQAEHDIVVEDSIFEGNSSDLLRGAAISVRGSTAFIIRSVFKENWADESVAGAIWIGPFSTTVVRDSVFAGNFAGPVEPDIGGEAGAILNYGDLTILNSTVSGNFAQAATQQVNAGCSGTAGAIWNKGTLRLLYSTVVDNNAERCPPLVESVGGGILNEGTLVVRGSIIAGNSADFSPDCADRGAGTTSSLGYSLLGIGDDCPGIAAPSDTIGTLALPVDPLLGPLAQSGGPGETHAVLDGSPAQGAIPQVQCVYDDDGDPLSPDVPLLADQRGVARPSFGYCEIGAYEKLAHCNDLIDNDGDGLVDLEDSGCSGPWDQSEKSSDFVCDDGLDNDGDGLVDFRVDGTGDPVCMSVRDLAEHAQCQDGIDNDSSFGIDFDGGVSIHGHCRFGWCPPGVSDPDGDGVADPDPHCVSPVDFREAGEPFCGLGSELGLLLPLLVALRRRSRARKDC